jgi:hypothetical protein
MWHAGRCGSTVIADLIQQDGRIDWAGEILEGFSKNPPSKAKNRSDVSEKIYRKIQKRQWQAGYHPFGFEMKLWHYNRLNMEFEEIAEILQRLGFNKNIVLERKNYLRIGVSAKIALATGQPQLRRGQQRRSIKVRIDVNDDRLCKGIDCHKHFYSELKEKLPSDFLYICYEDDIESDPYIGYKKIVEYLGFSPRDVSTEIVKINPKSLSDMIENYDEVANYLSNTPYYWMINS